MKQLTMCKQAGVVRQDFGFLFLCTKTKPCDNRTPSPYINTFYCKLPILDRIEKTRKEEAKHGSG